MHDISRYIKFVKFAKWLTAKFQSRGSRHSHLGKKRHASNILARIALYTDDIIRRVTSQKKLNSEKQTSFESKVF